MSKPKKRVSLRQRLRADALLKLEGLAERMREAAKEVAQDAVISPDELMRYVSSSKHKALQDALVTQLADEIERELREIYNKQMSLGIDPKLEDDDADAS